MLNLFGFVCREGFPVGPGFTLGMLSDFFLTLKNSDSSFTLTSFISSLFVFFLLSTWFSSLNLPELIFFVAKVYYLTPLLAHNKDKRGLALDGKLKHGKLSLGFFNHTFHYYFCRFFYYFILIFRIISGNFLLIFSLNFVAFFLGIFFYQYEGHSEIIGTPSAFWTLGEIRKFRS